MANEQLIEKAQQLLEKTRLLTLASVNEGGYPRPVPMVKVKTDGLRTIWFTTTTSSEKVVHFRSNPKAGISFYTEQDCVVLTGKVELITDSGVKKELWQDWFAEFYTKGVDDPEYMVLKFTSEDAILLFGTEFVKTAL